MSSRRPTILMLVLLLLIGAYLAFDHWRPEVTEWWELRKDPPLPGENRVGKLVLKQKNDFTWTVTAEYFYTGKPRFAQVMVRSRNAPAPNVNAEAPSSALVPAERGLHTVSFEIYHPGQGRNVSAVTESVTVQLTSFGRPPVESTLAQRIDWPDREAIRNRPENVLARAIDQIENGQYREAKAALEALVAREPKFDPAYLELARIAMKSNWSPEGLRNAETLIQTALQVRPDSTDARILLAYVCQHQERYPEAEALMKEVAQAGTKNLWHWANWGEWYQLQGRTDEAIAKYREGLEHPRIQHNSDRARPWMYASLLELVEARSDWAAADALYRRRIQDYPESECHALEFGDFLLHKRGDAEAALQALRNVKEARCARYSVADVRGAAYYLKWSADGAESDRAEALRQARVFLPSGPLMFYQLARSDAAAPAARKLIASGEKIGVHNSQHLDALAIALASHDLPAVQRLLKLGARTDSLVGEEKMPVALIPVLMRDLEAIRLLQKAGVDYGRIRFQGMTAPEVARQNGDAELLRALEPKGGGLAS